MSPKTAQTKGSQAKERLMNAATDLMILNGFEATSVDTICEKAGVNRGSFFYYFKSKEALGKEILERFSCKVGSSLQDSCCSAKDPLERVYGLIDAAIAFSKTANVKGCLIGTLTQEISNSHPELRSVCCESLDAAAAMIKSDLAEAKKKYAPEKKIDAEGLADYFVATTQGAMILMKARQERKVMEQMLTHFKNYLRSLFGK